jgi:hypothetical protein
MATYESGRQADRARYAAELAARMHAESGDERARYYALMQLVLNWKDDAVGAKAAFHAARSLEDAAWPARLLAHGAMTEGTVLTTAGSFVEARAAFRRAIGHALMTSERQSFKATVRIVELDIACGAIENALQLGRPLAISLRHSGAGETRFELLVLIFGALVLAGEVDEARAVGAELYDLAERVDPRRLYLVLDAMALLACRVGKLELAARIAACAEAAHESHGQAFRRPANEALRRAVESKLQEAVGTAWRVAGGNGSNRLDEAEACQLALGLRA